MDDGLECFDEGSDALHEESRDFYGCYILVSLNPKVRGRTYIGFTVNPNRRIRQHNAGRMKGGAKSTSGRGPWEMVLIVHGFPSEISALRFEWAWQNPGLSRRLTTIVAGRNPKETPFDYRFRVLCCMLRTGPWNRLGLIIRWINQSYFREFNTNLIPPLHMPVVFGPLKPSEKKGTESIPVLLAGVCALCGQHFDDSITPVICPAACSSGQWHLMCLARHMLLSQNLPNSPDKQEKIDYLIPLCAPCPSCGSSDLLWPNLIAEWKRRRESRSSLM
ncbi:hypothetical protein P879_04631 [Paragonimus westermani]|uniref:Structure-specific endonuclease subunit SLX1 homolog n=1 Tax=Paragonimus westermani TaxID=34504 RepID=A0A8T0DNF0_9TREM|nr:hypothetical protein P879_04631 [Paragonimus westermani]